MLVILNLLLEFIVTKLLLAFLITWSLPAQAWSLFGNYDDCVLDNIKNATTPQAVYAVKQACRSKYPLTRDECMAHSTGETETEKFLDCYKPPNKD